MAVVYTSTMKVRCWKEHACAGCGGSYEYLLVRTVKGQGNNEAKATEAARAAAVKAVEREVDSHPCPTCGLVQTDMIGARKVARHWWAFGLTLTYLLLLLILYASRVNGPDPTVGLAVGGGLVCLAANLLIDRTNPNRDTEANRARAGKLVAAGAVREVTAGEPGPPPAELAAPRWPVGQIICLGLMAVAVGVMAVPEVARAAAGWPLNPGWRHPVAGPGDETTVYLPEEVSSVKGYWNGSAQVTASVAGGPAFKIPAESNQANWGNNISAKASEKNQRSTLWAALRIPNQPDLAGKTLDVTIDLTVSYPETQGAGFVNQRRTVRHATTLRLGSAGAGAEYGGLFWAGFLGGSGLLLAMNVGLVAGAYGLRGRRTAVNVSAATGLCHPFSIPSS